MLSDEAKYTALIYAHDILQLDYIAPTLVYNYQTLINVKEVAPTFLRDIPKECKFPSRHVLETRIGRHDPNRTAGNFSLTRTADRFDFHAGTFGMTLELQAFYTTAWNAQIWPAVCEYDVEFVGASRSVIGDDGAVDSVLCFNIDPKWTYTGKGVEAVNIRTVGIPTSVYDAVLKHALHGGALLSLAHIGSTSLVAFVVTGEDEERVLIHLPYLLLDAFFESACFSRIEGYDHEFE